MRQQFDRQFPDGEGSATVPGTGKQSKLAEPARRSFAAYHDTVETQLLRTERTVHAISLRMKEDLGLTGRAQLASDRLGTRRDRDGAEHHHDVGGYGRSRRCRSQLQLG